MDNEQGGDDAIDNFSGYEDDEYHDFEESKSTGNSSPKFGGTNEDKFSYWQKWVTKDNPLGISPKEKALQARAIKKQLAYEIPVDLSQCSEEDKELWKIKQANIRNGGRLKENPL